MATKTAKHSIQINRPRPSKWAFPEERRLGRMSLGEMIRRGMV
jgi:hypothetical protein